MPSNVDKYLRRRALIRPLSRDLGPEICLWVVIPCYAEADFLPATIRSLQCCKVDMGTQVAVLVVVNNRAPAMLQTHAECEAYRQNLAMLQFLRDEASSSSLPILWIDAASEGNALPAKGGVGMARKLGCDSVLATVRNHTKDTELSERLRKTVLLHLDADTLVEPNYFAAADELLASGCPGGAIRFAHEPADTPEGQRAIDCYELYIHHYTQALRWARSPYAFHTVGSTMVCTLEGYLRADGVSAKRQAGEDFYFMQQLAKTGGVATLRKTCVHPSSRLSDRVPFGTGPRLRQAVHGDAPDFSVYPLRAIAVVRRLLAAVCEHPESNAAGLFERCECPEAEDFLEAKRFTEVWRGFQRQFKTPQDRIRAFHNWFDGLATFRLVNHLTTAWGALPLMDGWRELFEAIGEPSPPSTREDLLQWCRQHCETK
ncbi:MAG: hypothetical protein KAI66_20350 [Lentisphaeria bacterium]|nr:hypothetical protein [Lentisphaeria bacterium]